MGLYSIGKGIYDPCGALTVSPGPGMKIRDLPPQIVASFDESVDEEIRKGDVIWMPAGVKHWHGATPTTTMTHIAIQEQLNGKAVEWMEKVTDEQYRK